jgi:hypothetical protein
MFVTMSPRIPSGWLKHRAVLSTRALKQVQVSSKSGSNKGHFALEAESFLSLSRLALQWFLLKHHSGSPSPCATTSASLVEIGL